MARLIRFDKNHNLQFEGHCKLSINTLSSILVVEPENEEFKMISASFKWKYFPQKNFLFVIADFNFLDFCLVFKNEEICQKVFRLLPQQKNQESPKADEIETHFLVPMFEKIRDSPPASNLELIQIISHWFSTLENDEMKMKYIKLMKDMQIYDLITSILPNSESTKKSNSAIVYQKIPSKKRKFTDISKKSVCNRDTSEFLKYTNCIPSSQFRLIRHPNTRIRKLLIFASPKSTQLHEFKCHSKDGIFECTNLKCQRSSIIGVGENGEICAKLSSSDLHQCELLETVDELNSENFVEIKFVQKSNYIIHQNFNIHGTKILIILDPINNSQCYQYFWTSSRSAFICIGCSRKSSNKMKARLKNEGTDKEFVELVNVNHICVKISYNPEKFKAQFFNYILQPDFKIFNSHSHGKERKTLIIFDGKNHKLCYSYFFDSHYKKFVCCGCYKKKTKVIAKVRQNSDGIEYVILSNTKHVCELRNYIPIKEIVLRPPEIELMEETKSGIPKVFVFDKDDRKKCYLFTPNDANKFSNQLYFCTQCRFKSYRKKIINDVTGYLCKNEEDQSYLFRMKENQPHICQPRKYEPEKYLLIPKTYDFFFYRLKKNSKSLFVAFFRPDNRNLCFIMIYRNSIKKFFCCKCKAQNKGYSLKLEKDDDGKEYFRHDSKMHFCQPVKVSSITNFVKLQSSGLKETPKTEIANEIDESKIVKAPNFELRRSQTGIPNGKLVVINSEDKTLCHEYYFESKNKYYVCQKCREKKRTVSAKLQTQNEKTFVILGNLNHICTSIPYQRLRIVESSNFKIFKQLDEKMPMKIAIFTSESQEFCYEYSFRKKAKVFLCLGCSRLSKDISAKLLKNENGEEYLELSKTDHVCQPRKYETEKLQSTKPKLIPESFFEFRPNKQGIPDRHIIVFVDEKKDLYYNFWWSAKNYFSCEKCRFQKITVTLNVREKENGEKYLKTNGNEHICEPEKLKIVVKSFILYYKNNEANPIKMVIFSSSSHSKCYEYYSDKQYKNSFRCNGCANIKKSSSAKLIQCENGEDFVVEHNQHFCKPRKFEPCKFNMLKMAPNNH